MSEELAKKLAHRNAVNEGETEAIFINAPQQNVYVEFTEFTRKQIKHYEDIFKNYNIKKDNFIDQHELQLMMKELGEPQTFLSLKAMIQEVDEDGDNQISFREFLLIYRKVAMNEPGMIPGLNTLAQLTEIDVDVTGVGGAKDFFEAKAQAVSAGSKYEDEIKKEKEERKIQQEDARQKKAAFKAIAQTFE